MSSLDKKLEEITDLMKQFKAKIKQPKAAGIKPMKPPTPKIPGLPAASKKDPVAVARQISNPDIKPMAMDAAKQAKETLKISKQGQWSMNKAGEANDQENADGTENND